VTYLHNCWYVAAWSEEIAPGATLARTYLEQPVVLFRQEDGTAGALLDRCPHRFAPLSAGKVVGDRIQCPYHGLEFTADGVCARNPYGPGVRSIRVRSIPLVERHRALWIWMGDPDSADAGRIPDLSYLAEAPSTAFSCGYLLTRANFEIVSDNILDLTHTEYLHPTTLAGNQVVQRVKPTTRETPEGVEVTWFAPNVPLLKLFQAIHPEVERAAMLTQVSWCAPAIMKLRAATIPADATGEEGFVNLNAHVMTPETNASTHYFFAATRNYRTEDAALNDFIAESRKRIFSMEDKPMIELVQQRMAGRDFWDMRPLLLGGDEAAVRARRRLHSLIAAEARAAQSAPVSAAQAAVKTAASDPPFARDPVNRC